MTVRMRWLIAGALLLLASGCSTKVEVQSDTSWTGVVNGASVAGQGSSTWDAKIPSGGSKYQGQELHGCATFTKTTESGVLRVRFHGWNGDDRWVSTSAPFGSATACPSN